MPLHSTFLYDCSLNGLGFKITLLEIIITLPKWRIMFFRTKGGKRDREKLFSPAQWFSLKYISKCHLYWSPYLLQQDAFENFPIHNSPKIMRVCQSSFRRGSSAVLIYCSYILDFKPWDLDNMLQFSVYFFMGNVCHTIKKNLDRIMCTHETTFYYCV